MSAIDRIEELAKAATPGPWLQGKHVDEPRALCPASALYTSLLGLDVDGMAIVQDEADAAHIAANNPAAVLKLVAALRAAQVVIGKPLGLRTATSDEIRAFETAVAALEES